MYSTGSRYFDAHRTMNGHGNLTSVLSSTEIGARHVSTFNPEYVKAYRKAAETSIKQSQTFRSTKALDAMMGATVMAETVQPNSKIYKNSYPETHKKLREAYKDRYTNATPRELHAATATAFDRDIHFHPPDFIYMEPSESTRNIGKEEEWNKRERLLNKHKATDCVVHSTITGEFTRQKTDDILVPVGATHHQVLGIDNKLVGMNPLVNAPVTKDPLKWYGDTVGWAGNNGLKSNEAQKRFKDSMIAVTRGDMACLKNYSVHEEELHQQKAIQFTPRTARDGSSTSRSVLDTSSFY
jgi:hypothetical protein